MDKNFWQKLPRPIKILAPMEDVTDTVFRRIVAGCGRPDVFFTEFTSTDGMFSAGADAVMHRLEFTPGERPLVAQIWGNDPENYLKAARLLVQMGFDGIDINMGCPVSKIIKSGCCSGLITQPALAAELIAAAKEGAQSIPVSVKTRIGFNKVQTEEWIPFLLSQGIAALTVHGRTAKQLSKVPADWSEIQKAVVARNNLAPETIIIGNGDVMTHAEINEKAARYGVDGVMVGRGIFHNLFLFNPEMSADHLQKLSLEEKLRMLLQHGELFSARWGGKRRFSVLKKFFKIYISHFDGAMELRVRLMETETLAEAREVIESWKLSRQTKPETQESPTHVS